MQSAISKKVILGVLISGRGSNLLALAEAIRSGQIEAAEIGIVISDQTNAAGLSPAAERGIKTLVVRRAGRTREEHEAEIVEQLRNRNVELVCLAGYMRILSTSFINAYAGRILNIHPSLLPAFPGLAAQRQALDHGVKWSGCTVHFVDETLDGGPIVLQTAVPVLDQDTEESLSARILEQEHRLYPDAVALITSGNYEVVGRRVLRKNR
jgi:phosphoribosylglycinamide formyltransferase-1